MERYELIIIGGGCAGLTAALFSGRYKLKTMVIAEDFGGMLNEADRVENFPGFNAITGIELMDKIKEQVQRLGIELRKEIVGNIEKTNEGFIVTTKKSKYSADAIIIATGSKRRKINIRNEDKFLGKGLSYCAWCDADMFYNKTVAVIGGSDAAAQSALLLSKKAERVYIIYRRDKLRAEPMHVDKIEKSDNIEIIYNTNVVDVRGVNKLEYAVLDKEYKGSNELKLDGIFVEIGSVPSTGLASKLGVRMNEKNEIIIDAHAKTNIDGIYAAGDVTDIYLKQAITACGFGAIAAFSVFKRFSLRKKDMQKADKKKQL